MQLRQLHMDYWEEKAEKVLSNFHYSTPDEIDIFEICRRYGIRVLPLDKHFIDDNFEFDDGIKAFSVPKKQAKRGTIYIKEGLNEIEKKLLVAEEFCHLYSHHTSQLGVDQYIIAKNEKQAKKMSAYLLMPSRFIKKVYDSAMDEAVVISEIADYFFVTDEFAHYRMELIFHHKVDVFAALRGKLGTLEWFN